MNQTLVDQFGPDTIRKFMSAAPLRFEEAEVLMREGHHLAAIYLLGYCAEMLTKAAYFRAQGPGETVEIDPETRHRIEVRARMDGLMSSEPHDLVGWARLLVTDKSKLYHPAYERRFGQRIIDQALTIYECWRPWMRYRSTRVGKRETQAVHGAANWFINNYSRM